MTRTMYVETKTPPTPISEGQTIGHLEEILASESFSASRRCQQFLSFVVHETLQGRGDAIKERTIAIEVFGKDHHFEPGEDSLVRVKAREVRKRLAEFYQQHPDTAVRIDLPLGGYIPRIQKKTPEITTPLPSPPGPIANHSSKMSRRAMLWTGAACAAGLAAWPVIKYAQRPSTPLEQFWQPVFATGRPLLIAIPLLAAEDGSITERVGMGAAAAANEAAEYFVSVRYPYRLRFGSDLTFAQLCEQPSLLLGGFSSVWTTRMTQALRYSLVRNVDGAPGGSIVDSFTKQTYGPIRTRNGYASEDYAIVCRLFDAASGQIILIAAGITTFGTESAAHFFFRPDLFSQIVQGHDSNWQKKNFQAVIHVSVIETTPSTPTLVATHFW
ncbi:MAG: hypothetical protein JSS87_00545 [Acidobacteria bacterium]|nr:hypothetical protein [Acidobacteriota bacterium]